MLAAPEPEPPAPPRPSAPPPKVVLRERVASKVQGYEALVRAALRDRDAADARLAGGVDVLPPPPARARRGRRSSSARFSGSISAALAVADAKAQVPGTPVVESPGRRASATPPNSVARPTLTNVSETPRALEIEIGVATDGAFVERRRRADIPTRALRKVVAPPTITRVAILAVVTAASPRRISPQYPRRDPRRYSLARVGARSAEPREWIRAPLPGPVRLPGLDAKGRHVVICRARPARSLRRLSGAGR